MNLNDFLLYMDKYAEENGYKVYIIGGAVRDSFLKPEFLPADIDVTTGDKTIYSLGYGLSKEFSGSSNFILFSDGHSTIKFENFSIDFSNNFISGSVERVFEKRGEKASNLKKECYSRDFTINTLLMNLKRDTIWDTTKRGVADIKDKVIRCPINPVTTFMDDPKRMLRAIKYSLKLGFKINEEEESVIKRYAKAVENLPTNYVKNIVSDIIDIDAEKGIAKLYELKLLKHIPLTKKLTKLLTERRELIKYFR